MSSSRIRCRWVRERGTWFWGLVAVTVPAVLLLWGGTQAAIARGQDVEWYAGFGQWLGALGSLLAAGAALWIATTDRRRADRQQGEDLAREAGLARVEIVPMEGEETETDRASTLISIRNLRRSRLFELKLERLVVAGKGEISTSIQKGSVVRNGRFNRLISDADDWVTTVLDTEESFIARVECTPDQVAFVAFRYTDETGRRWEVCNTSRIARSVHVP